MTRTKLSVASPACATCRYLKYVDWANTVLKQPMEAKDGYVLISERPGKAMERYAMA
jgi:L-alanine-DL-glutamate epimerase-like enolase superfamily enzyme